MKVSAFFVSEGQGGIIDDIIDWAISKTTNSKYVHAGLIFESKDGDYMVHVNREGIFSNLVSDYEYDFDVLDFKIDTTEKFLDIKKMADSKLAEGNEYDYLQILKIWIKSVLKICIPEFISIKEAYICSTLIIEAAKILGHKFDQDEELYSPGDLHKMKDLFCQPK
jgi:hypothetical protein